MPRLLKFVEEFVEETEKIMQKIFKDFPTQNLVAKHLELIAENLEFFTEGPNIIFSHKSVQYMLDVWVFKKKSSHYKFSNFIGKAGYILEFPHQPYENLEGAAKMGWQDVVEATLEDLQKEEYVSDGEAYPIIYITNIAKNS